MNNFLKVSRNVFFCKIWERERERMEILRFISEHNAVNGGNNVTKLMPVYNISSYK